MIKIEVDKDIREKYEFIDNLIKSLQQMKIDNDYLRDCKFKFYHENYFKDISCKNRFDVEMIGYKETIVIEKGKQQNEHFEEWV